MSEEYQLLEKWSEDAVDESGNKLSKRYVACLSNTFSDQVPIPMASGIWLPFTVLLQRVEEA